MLAIGTLHTVLVHKLGLSGVAKLVYRGQFMIVSFQKFRLEAHFFLLQLYFDDVSNFVLVFGRGIAIR